MVRIKGANSDYTYVGTPQEAPIQEDKRASPLYLEIFLCPNDMPSRVEAPHGGKQGAWCNGTDHHCPAPTGEIRQTGHAKIRLDQERGILLSTKDTEVLQLSEQGIKAAIAIAGQSSLHLDISPAGIMLQTPDGASIHLSDSTITLTPGPRGQVTVAGSLHVTGDLEVTGQMRSPTLTTLAQRLTRLERPR